MHKVILHMIVTKDLDNKVFDYIDPWGETLACIEWAIMDSYNCTIQATPDQDVFGRDMIFNLVSVLDWRVINTENQRQVDIDNARENSGQVIHDYSISDQAYVEMNGIYRKLDYSKKGPYNHISLYKWYNPSPTGTSNQTQKKDG